MSYWMPHLRSALQVVFLATCILGSAQANAQYINNVPWSNPTFNFTLQSDVVYGQGEVNFSGGGGTFEDLELDLYIPDIPPPPVGYNRMPLMVMIHGGGFSGGSKTNVNVVASAEEYARHGWLVAAINYRLESDDPVPSSRVQAMYDHFGGASATLRDRTRVAAIDDTLMALDFLHARVDVVDWWTTLWGSSAGGNTALGASYALDDHGIPRPPMRNVIEISGRFEDANIGNPFDNPAPVLGDSPLMTVTGTLDPLYIFSQETQTWAIAAGLAHDWQAVTGVGHTPDMFTNLATTQVTLFQRSVDWHHETVFAGKDQGPQPPPPGC
jgi:hypothetical protein